MQISTCNTPQTNVDIDLFNSIGVALWLEDASHLYKELSRIEVVHECSISKFFETHPQEIPRLIDLIKIIDVNAETLALYNASSKEDLKKGIRNFFIKESFQDFTKMLLHLYQGANSYSYTSSKITIKGKKVITRVSVKIPESAKYDWSQMIVTEIEVSDFIKREVGLMIQSEKATQESENKDKILSIIAHDLKNPFNTILGFSELFLSKYETLSDERRIEFVKYIHESAHHSYQLLSNLLHWSKMHQVSMGKDIKQYSLHTILDSITALIHTTCIAKCITIHEHIEPSLQICVEINMFTFVLRNVLTNAIKFSYKNSDIFISAHQEQNKVIIAVSDNGIGMDSHTQLSLFNPEKIQSRKGTDNELGTGIGLMLCKEFIEKQHGTLDLESEEGVGTNVIITIPAAK